MCGGGQLLVSGSYFQGPGCQGPMSQGHKTQVPGFQFQGLRVPSSRVLGPRVSDLGSWISGPRVLGPRPQVSGPDCRLCFAFHLSPFVFIFYFFKIRHYEF